MSLSISPFLTLKSTLGNIPYLMHVFLNSLESNPASAFINRPLVLMSDRLSVVNNSFNELSILYRSWWLPAIGLEIAKDKPCLSVSYNALVVYLFFLPWYTTFSQPFKAGMWLPSMSALDKFNAVLGLDNIWIQLSCQFSFLRHYLKWRNTAL